MIENPLGDSLEKVPEENLKTADVFLEERYPVGSEVRLDDLIFKVIASSGALLSFKLVGTSKQEEGN